MAPWLKLGATAVAAVAVAEGAAWLLSPSDLIDPVAVDAAISFPLSRSRAVDYRSGQRLLFAGGLAAQAGVLVALVAGRPRRVRELLERAGEHPVPGGLAAAGGLVLALAVVTLPFDIASHERAVDVGLSTQDLAAWFGDWAKSNAISAVIAGAIGTGAMAMIRRSPRTGGSRAAPPWSRSAPCSAGWPPSCWRPSSTTSSRWRRARRAPT